MVRPISLNMITCFFFKFKRKNFKKYSDRSNNFSIILRHSKLCKTFFQPFNITHLNKVSESNLSQCLIRQIFPFSVANQLSYFYHSNFKPSKSHFDAKLRRLTRVFTPRIVENKFRRLAFFILERTFLKMNEKRRKTTRVDTFSKNWLHARNSCPNVIAVESGFEICLFFSQPGSETYCSFLLLHAFLELRKKSKKTPRPWPRDEFFLSLPRS